ncbi:MAG: right-handed parallel beta-helix repeat-containing protein [Clostridia bacterium]|nr:right-handed parallel beta-helix repeat-containing protein [Clostridia bacterium]
MKNRKLLLIVSLVLAMTMSLGGTLAYLQDTDADVNTMVLGNVKIEQHEYERVGDEKVTSAKYGEGYKVQAFTQDKPLLPAVGAVSGTPENDWEETQVYWDQLSDKASGGQKILKGIENIQDKFVLVENTGNTKAYVRTYIAFEAGSKSFEQWNDLVMTSTSGFWARNYMETPVAINGNNYVVVEYVYTGSSSRHVGGILPAGEYTYNSLGQIYLMPEATNEDLIALDGNGNEKYDILVLSQAIQADGFADAATALNEGFGAFNATNVKTWFEGEDVVNELPVIKTVSTAQGLQDALNNVNSDTTIVLANDIEDAGSLTYYQAVDRAVTIDGNGYKYEGIIMVNGKSAGIDSSALTIQDVNFVGRTATKTEDAYIMLGKSGDSNTRYTRNVTITNCTFEGDSMVAVKSYTGGDKNVTIENCTVKAGMHSLCQLANVEEGLTITDCKVYSKNGAGLNQTENLEMSGCTFDVQGYAVRFGVDNETETPTDFVKTFQIKDSTLKSACAADDDAVIVFRDTATNATLTLENVTLDGKVEFLGNTANTKIITK